MPFGKRRREMKSIDEFNHEIERLSELKDDACKRAEYDEAAAIREELNTLKLEFSHKMALKSVDAVNTIFENIKEKRPLRYADCLVTSHPDSSIAAHSPHNSNSLDVVQMQRSHIRYYDALADIVSLTDYDSPGIYEPITVAKVNTIAREILGMPITLSPLWAHNQPTDPDAPREISPDILAAYQVLYGKIIKEALGKLSGTLSHDNVAAAKQILKKILD